MNEEIARDSTPRRTQPEPGMAMTSARKALLAYGEAWTTPILGNEDVPFVERLFEAAREQARQAVLSPEDPSEFARWLKTLLGARENLEAWEDTLFEIADYFGLSKDTSAP